MTSPIAPKDKIFEKVMNPYLTEVLQHPQSIEMHEGMLHICDVEGPKKTRSVETRLEAMEQQVFKCQGMVVRGLNANHVMITEFTSKHMIDANDIGKHLSRLYDRIDQLHAQIYDLQNQNLVETTVSFKDFREALCCEYPWSPGDVVELRYFDSTEQRFVPLTCDEHLGLLFSLNADIRFYKIHISVLQACKQRIPKGIQISYVSANSERPRTPCRSRPSKPSGSESHNMSAAANSSTSPHPYAPGVEVDAEPDEEVPRHDDEDEILFHELVDRVTQHVVEDEYVVEPSSRARFDDTDDEERKENIDSLVLQEYDGEDMPTIEWNRESPDLTPGTILESMVDCRNAVTTYCIVTENSYEVDRSEPGRFTVHCPYDR
ncbi:40S ribosomal protein S5-1 [Hordeum vulgare]|nr:40S ribosomal protein S5-1 [Hordeum vulgare]